MTLSPPANRPRSLRRFGPGVSGFDLHLVLVNPEIHWNTGNAGRTCLATDALLHLVEPLGFSLAEREVRRAGLDYWERVPRRVWPSWAELEARLAELGEPWFFSSEGLRCYTEVGYSRPAVLVFGRESDGLPAELRRRWAERLVRIPMADADLRSINLSTAAAVALYEVRRQWGALSSSPAPAAAAAPAPRPGGSRRRASRPS
jgi:tRNA (cytidine/uridine-2'-O-)-methyltransferase